MDDNETKVVSADERHFTDFGWLKTYWLFSFSDYFDPDNLNWGALRVFNDDVVLAQKGFPTHPHREMEIVSIVLSGALSHKDSTGQEGTIKAGDVQRMSAGTGVTHSEYNHDDVPVHFYQIWMEPGVHSLSPSYEQKHFDENMWQNNLLPIASGQGIPGTVSLHTNATIYRSQLDKGQTVTLASELGRKVFIYLTSGELIVDEKSLNSLEQMRLVSPGVITIKAKKASEFILIDSPKEAAPPEKKQAII